MITGLIERGHKVSLFSFRKNKDSYIHPDIRKYGLLNIVTYEKFPQQLPECDIVFCQFGGLGKVLLEMPQLSTWLEQRKMVVCLRGFDVMDYVKNSPYINSFLFKKIDLFLPVCAHFKKRFVALGCPAEKVIVHHSAINCSQFFFKIRKKPDRDFINAVFVGRLVRKKGIPYAIKALAEVLKKHKDVRLTIIGEGPEREKLVHLIKKLRLDKQYVRLAGWKSQDEIVAALNKAHIFIHPSVTHSNGNEEGIANSLKEAMAMGLISIATWHAGTPKLINDSISGFLVPEKNSDALARAINYVIEHPEKWQSIGQAARKKVEEEFECKNLAQELETIFYTLLDTGKKTEEIQTIAVQQEQAIIESRENPATEEIFHDIL
jgi:colanic acid/amylovoran biosynthesis glycosyltransferase